MRVRACKFMLLLLPLVRGKPKSQHFNPVIFTNPHEFGILGHQQNLVPDYYYDDISDVQTSQDDTKKANKNYQFSYGVSDPEKGTSYSRNEIANEKGTTGQYQVHLPDGRIQTVTYTADENGYRAEVSYEGEAVHDIPAPTAASPSFPQHKSVHNSQQARSIQPIPQIHNPGLSHFEGEDYQDFHHQEPHHDTTGIQLLEKEFLPGSRHETLEDEALVTATPLFDFTLGTPSSLLNSNSFDPRSLQNSIYVTSPALAAVGPPPTAFAPTPHPFPFILTPKPHGPVSLTNSIAFSNSHPFSPSQLSTGHFGGPIPVPHPIINSHAKPNNEHIFDFPIFRKDTAIKRFARATTSPEDSTAFPIY